MYMKYKLHNIKYKYSTCKRMRISAHHFLHTLYQIAMKACLCDYISDVASLGFGDLRTYYVLAHKILAQLRKI